jgi:hypothetical protein
MTIAPSIVCTQRLRLMEGKAVGHISLRLVCGCTVQRTSCCSVMHEVADLAGWGWYRLLPYYCTHKLCRENSLRGLPLSRTHSSVYFLTHSLRDHTTPISRPNMQRSRQSGSYDKKQEEELEARLAVEKRQLREQSIQQRRLLQAQTQHEMCQKQQQAQSSSSRQQRQQNNVRHKTIRGHEMFGTGNSLSLIRAAMNYAEPQHDFDALFPDLNSAGG